MKMVLLLFRGACTGSRNAWHGQ